MIYCILLVQITYLKAEFAQSEGPGFAQANSIDGGLSFTDIASPGVNVTAQAYRAEFAVNIAELQERQGNRGKFSGFFEHLDEGFSAAGRLSPTQTQRWGLAAELPIGEIGHIKASYDSFDAEGRGSNQTAEIDISNRFAVNSGALTTSLGVRHDSLAPGVLLNSVSDGSRTDARNRQQRPW